MNTPSVGGAERHTFDLAYSLQHHGFVPNVFAMKAGTLSPLHGVTLLQPKKDRRLFWRIADLSRTLKAIRPALVIAVNERPVFASYLAARLASFSGPIVGICHSTILRN